MTDPIDRGCEREDELRAEQEARGEKPRYDRRWRPEPGKTLPAIPADVEPVIRFRTPLDGTVAWDHATSGQASTQASHRALDKLICSAGAWHFPGPASSWGTCARPPAAA